MAIVDYKLVSDSIENNNFIRTIEAKEPPGVDSISVGILNHNYQNLHKDWELVYLPKELYKETKAHLSYSPLVSETFLSKLNGT